LQLGVAAVCFDTFLKLKRWMRVRRAGKYFGQFECYKCLRHQQLPQLMRRETNPAEYLKLGQELEEANKHQQVSFGNEVSTRKRGITSNRVNSCC
jgi:hypothetical protein